MQVFLPEVLPTKNQQKSITESDASVFEVAVEPKVIPVYELDKSEEKSDSSVYQIDNSSENSDLTTKIYKKLMDGDTSKISLQTVSTLSTAPYKDLSNDVPESEESDLKKQIATCISHVEKDVSVGVIQNPQNGVTEKSVVETDKQENVSDEVTDKSETKQVSEGVEDNPQICVMEKSVEEKDKVGDQVRDKNEEKAQIEPVEIKEKDSSPSDTTDESVTATSSYCESPNVQPTEVTDSTDLSKTVTDDRHKEFAEAFGPQEEL